MRPQINRVIVVVSLAVLLPVVMAAERVRPGWGRRSARAGVRLVAAMCGVQIAVESPERMTMSRPCIFVPNHSSLLDIPAMLVACPDVPFLAASELFRVPLLAGAMRALGTVPIERRRPDVARRQMDALLDQPGGVGKDGLVVFAEGAIAPAGEVLPFKTGAFVLAIRTGMPVVPVAIRHSGDLLAPGHRLALKPGKVTVQLLEAIPTAALGVADRRALRDEVRAAVLSALVRPGARPGA